LNVSKALICRWAYLWRLDLRLGCGRSLLLLGTQRGKFLSELIAFLLQISCDFFERLMGDDVTEIATSGFEVIDLRHKRFSISAKIIIDTLEMV
jgi:hypothetical protein